MTQDEVLTKVKEVFGNLPRPAMFIRGTCECEECLEHEQDMQSFVRDSLPLDKLNMPGWDPICFASDEAFAYLLPGLVRLTLEHADEYVDQFLFHVGDSERIAALSKKQSEALLNVLDFLAMDRTKAIKNHLVFNELDNAREKLQQRAGIHH